MSLAVTGLTAGRVHIKLDWSLGKINDRHAIMLLFRIVLDEFNVVRNELLRFVPQTRGVSSPPELPSNPERGRMGLESYAWDAGANMAKTRQI